MQKKTYGDKQREAQQLKRQEELSARTAKNASPQDPSPAVATPADTTEATKKTPKANNRGRRPA